MSRDAIQDFIEKARALDTLRKNIDERLTKFLATAKCLAGFDSQRRERWRSLTTTTMWIPNQIDDNVAISPKDWLTLDQVGQLLDSWHRTLHELDKAWHRLQCADQSRLASLKPPGY
jgi:hypothetical protein